MGLLENISIAMEGLKLNKMRSFLTMLGIIIGIASVIAIISIGDSMSKSVSKGFDSFGTNTISMYVHPKKDSGIEWSDVNNRDYFPLEFVDRVQERFEDRIQAIDIRGAGSSGEIKKGRDVARVNISATSPGAKDTGKVKMINGRFLEELDVSQNKNVAVVSDKVVEKIYNNKIEDALGSLVDVRSGSSTYSYTIVGVYKDEPISFGMMGGESANRPSNLYIPYTVGNRQFAKKDTDTTKLSSLTVMARDRNDVDPLKEDLKIFFNENIYQNNERVEMSADTVAGQLEEISNVMNTMKLAIGGIAAISLIVGGIGVMNILLVSVTERTREIGIRKALGATNTDIQGQFIIESIIICIIGGAIGVLIGGAGGYAASTMMKSPTLPSLFSIAVAVGFSMFIGVFFGYYPASQAAKLNPIDALRHE